jgi:trigger factor
MSLKSVDTTEKNTAVLEIEIAREKFNEAVTKVFRSKSAGLSVPGFRKGKAPRNIIEKMYGKGVFYEDALNELLPQSVDDAVAESKIKAVSRPEIDVKSVLEDGGGVVFTAKFTVKPEVGIKNYKGLEAEKITVAPSDEDVDKEIEAVRKRNARSIEVSESDGRPAEKDDEATIDFEGFVDGVPFEGGKAADHKLKLGSGHFIAGFEDQIIGRKIGEEFDVSVKFPDDYHGEDVKGKDAVFKVRLGALRYEELPELDDEFAQDVSDFETLGEYRADLKIKIKERNDSRSEYALEEQLVDGIIANLEADVPEIMITGEVDNQFRDYAYRLQSQGIDMDRYMQYAGMTPENMRAQFRVGAERQVKTRLALEKIAAIENIGITPEDFEKEYEKIAEMYKIEKDKVKEQVDENALREDLLVRKAVEFVKNNANITESVKTLHEFEKYIRKSKGGEDGAGADQTAKTEEDADADE